MASNFRSVLAFGVGFAGGWAARSLSDSPQGVGVKLLEVAMNTKERVGRWAAVERERLEDMMAEAKSKVEPDISLVNGAANQKKTGSGQKIRSMNGDA
jgi:hypothetical protein